MKLIFMWLLNTLKYLNNQVTQVKQGIKYDKSSHRALRVTMEPAGFLLETQISFVPSLKEFSLEAFTEAVQWNTKGNKT